MPPFPSFLPAVRCMASFGKVDLGLLFADADAEHGTRETIDVSKHAFKPRIDHSKKVKHHRAGAMPGWVGDAESVSGPGDGEGEGAAFQGQGLGKVRERARGAVGMAAARAKAKAKAAPVPAPAPTAARSEQRLEEAEVLQLSSSDADSDAAGGDSDSDSDGERSGSDSDSSVPGDVVIVNAVDEAPVDEETIASLRASVRERLKAKGPVAAVAQPRAATRVLLPAIGEAVPFSTKLIPSARRGLHSDEETSDDSDTAAAVGKRGKAKGRGYTSSQSDTSDSEDDSDDSSEPEKLMMPIFRAKADRTTIHEKERKEEEEEQKRLARLQELEQRKIDSKHLVADIVKREEAEQRALQADEEDERFKPSDIDDPTELETDMRAWAIREMTRLKTDKARREAVEEELRETARRSQLSDEARAIEDKELERQGLRVFHKEKQSMKFMQKYRHKGVFYMDETSVKSKDDIRLRANNEATGIDQFDKSALPKPLQVRGDDFGKRGRTKWTHLTEEDTTFKSQGNAWADKHNPLRLKMEQKMGGLGDINTAGRVVRGSAKRKAEEM